MEKFENRIAFRAWLAGAVCAVLAGCGAGGGPDGEAKPAAKIVTASVTLTGAQEIPLVLTAGAGSGTLTFDTETGAVSGQVDTFGVRGPRVMLREGAIGANGPVIAELAPAGFDTVTRNFTWKVPPGTVLTPAQIESLKEGNLYVNAISPEHGSGEIRGQVGRQVYFASLTGAQETPPVASPASGTGRFVFDPATHSLGGSIATVGASGVAAELRIGEVGAAGTVAIALAGGRDDWSVTPDTRLGDAAAAALAEGKLYVNVHSANHPDGEIRGQIYAPLRSADMSGAAETPAVATAGNGRCWMAVNPFDKSAVARVQTTITDATTVDVHRAAASAAGPAVVVMVPAVDAVGATRPGVWDSQAVPFLGDDGLASFMKDDLYCDVLTTSHSDGEIRGQLAPMP